jgi:hypothetical protein
MSDDLVALVNNRGASEANVNCVSYLAGVEGIFHVPADVAQALLALPAGFARADDEQPTLETTMTRDFLALDPAGNPQPHAQLEVGGPSGRYERGAESFRSHAQLRSHSFAARRLDRPSRHRQVNEHERALKSLWRRALGHRSAPCNAWRNRFTES